MMKRTLPGTAVFLVLALGSAGAETVPTTEHPGIFVAPPGQEGMHRELIPKNITIERCTYDLDVVAPGTTFGFDVVGSGFDEAFYKIISIDPDALDVTAINLRLVTPNQIHGQIEVGTEATTQYIHPKVIIRALPVFRAPDPFGVVRRGEVLDILLTSIDETGQWGRFQVITNLDEGLFTKFRIDPTNPKLEVSNVKARYPFYVEGVVMISEGLQHGQYGIVTYLGKRELFRQDPLVDVVKPTVGKTGSIEKVRAVEMAHRPGDMLELTVTGSAFLPDVVSSLSAQVNEFAMGPANFTFVSAGKLGARLPIPPNAPVGAYGISILYHGKVLEKESNIFAIVPPNWLASVNLTMPLGPGKSGQLLVAGRDITPDFAKTLALETDTEGLKISNLRWQNASSVVADIAVAPTIEPGDYIIHVSAGGKPLRLPRGNIIKITP
jgi:hypothetical protein